MQFQNLRMLKSCPNYCHPISPTGLQDIPISNHIIYDAFLSVILVLYRIIQEVNAHFSKSYLICGVSQPPGDCNSHPPWGPAQLLVLGAIHRHLGPIMY